MSTAIAEDKKTETKLNQLDQLKKFTKVVADTADFETMKEFKLKMAWKLLHKIDKVLFAQMIVTQMLSKHRILTQVAGHAMDVMKILPPLIIGEKEVEMFVNALDDVLTECRKFPGPMWELGNNFVKAALGSKRTAEARPAVSA